MHCVVMEQVCIPEWISLVLYLQLENEQFDLFQKLIMVDNNLETKISCISVNINNDGYFKDGNLSMVLPKA